MDWKKTLRDTFIVWFLLGMLIGMLGCSHTRDITICQIDGDKANCANTEEEWVLPLGDIQGYYCVDEADLRKVMDKLEYCEEL